MRPEELLTESVMTAWMGSSFARKFVKDSQALVAPDDKSLNSTR